MPTFDELVNNSNDRLASLQALLDSIGENMLEDIRWNGCELEKKVNGTWQAIGGGSLAACLPSGGGLLGLSVVTKSIQLSSQQNTNSTSYTSITGSSFNHTFTKPNALVQITLIGVNSDSAADTFVRPIVNGAAGLDGTEARNRGTNGRTLIVADRFSNIPTGTSIAVAAQFRASSGQAQINQNMNLVYSILEYDALGQNFVQEVRWNDCEIQQKINGIWYTIVGGSLNACLEPLQDAINAASATAATALATANSAVATNTLQASSISSLSSRMSSAESNVLNLQGRMTSAENAITAAINVNINQNNRLDNIEQVDIFQINLRIDDHEARLDSLEGSNNVFTFGNVWAWEHSFELYEGGYILGSSGAGWTNGLGWLSNGTGLQIVQTASDVLENNISHIRVRLVYTTAPNNPQFRVNGGDWASIKFNGLNQSSFGWYRLPNRGNVDLTIEFSAGDFALKQVYYLGRGDDLPFD